MEATIKALQSLLLLDIRPKNRSYYASEDHWEQGKQNIYSGM